VGALGILGIRGYHEMYKIKLTYYVLNFCPVSERNHEIMLGLYLRDFVVGV
jgi:hypothetical protein